VPKSQAMARACALLLLSLGVPAAADVKSRFLRGAATNSSAANETEDVPATGIQDSNWTSDQAEESWDNSSAVYVEMPANLSEAMSLVREAEEQTESADEKEAGGELVPSGGAALQELWQGQALYSGGGGCRYHAGSPDCHLYRLCRGQRVCVVGHHLVVPGESVPGMESINGGSARHLDYLWYAARGHCGSDGCVLLVNPVGHRTQDQLHIHFWHMNGRGPALKHQLEQSLCGKYGWRSFRQCGHAKARMYNSMPGVFSEVARAFGGGSLAHVGITVMFTHACGGGQKVMILATTGCSLEHDISPR